MRNDQVIQVRIPSDLKEAAQERAEREGINLSEFIRGALESYTDGLDDDPEPHPAVLP